MGCCGSKEEHEDDIREPLLGTDTNNDSRLTYQSTDMIDPKQEQDFWNSVIERTTQNLIDISSSQTDALQEQDINERTEKYRDIINQIPYKHRSSLVNNNTKLNGTPISPSLSTAHHHHHHISTSSPTSSSAAAFAGLDHINVDTLINLVKTNHEFINEQKDWLNETVEEIQQALGQFEVQPVGDMVIHLATPNSIHIQSY
ncbi:hypothetical protein BJ944DRAFT_286798 [Cunninghamella echinulata]|nr:hypothetical protein BJ944DRAFT_286798 [Cunninghamella echinulata]